MQLKVKVHEELFLNLQSIAMNMVRLALSQVTSCTELGTYCYPTKTSWRTICVYLTLTITLRGLYFKKSLS